MSATSTILPAPRPWAVPLAEGRSLLIHAHSDQVGHELSMQYHPEFELTLVRSGAGRRLVGNACDHYQDGDLALIGPGLPHGWTVDVDQDCEGPSFIVMLFTRHSLGLELLAKPEFAAIDRLLNEAGRGLAFSPDLQADLDQLFVEAIDAEPSRQFLLCLQILDHLVRKNTRRPITGSDYRPTRDQRELALLAKILRFIQTASHRQIPLEEAAAYMDMSVPTFTRFFRRHTGTSFIAYVNRWRIEQAQSLLRETRRPIIDIAFTVGFGNLSHFNRQFRRLTGCSPRSMRKGRMDDDQA